MATKVVAAQSSNGQLIGRMAGKFGVDDAKLVTTLKHTAFRQRDGEVSNEQMMALMVVADQYGLNPFTREIYAFPDRQGIVPVVGVDGWSRIINDHDQLDGIEFHYGPDTDDGHHEWIECTIYRKDRAHPVTAREYWREVRRDTGPWKSHGNRMHRHKALIQCARIAFGFSGIYDPDEADAVRVARQMGDAHVVGKPEVTPPRRLSVTEAEPPAEPATDGAPDAAVIAALEKRADTCGWSEKELCATVNASDYASMTREQVDAALTELEASEQ